MIGMLDGGLGLADVLQISLRPGVEFAGLGKVSERFGEALGAGGEMIFELSLSCRNCSSNSE